MAALRGRKLPSSEQAKYGTFLGICSAHTVQQPGATERKAGTCSPGLPAAFPFQAAAVTPSLGLTPLSSVDKSDLTQLTPCISISSGLAPDWPPNTGIAKRVPPSPPAQRFLSPKEGSPQTMGPAAFIVTLKRTLANEGFAHLCPCRLTGSAGPDSPHSCHRARPAQACWCLCGKLLCVLTTWKEKWTQVYASEGSRQVIFFPGSGLSC